MRTKVFNKEISNKIITSKICISRVYSKWRKSHVGKVLEIYPKIIMFVIILIL